MKNLRAFAVLGFLGALGVNGWSQSPDRCRDGGYARGVAPAYSQYRTVSDRGYDRPHYRRDSTYGAYDRYDNRGRYGRADNGYYNGGYPNNNGYNNNGRYNSGYSNNGYYENGDRYYYERPGSHSAAIIGGSAAAGAGVGAAMGGVKGAIIGGVVGGAAGAVVDRSTRRDTRW